MDPLFKKVHDVYLSNNSIKKTSCILDISRSKVKKILISIGLYESNISNSIVELKNKGYKKDEICELLKISPSFYNENTPYDKCLYNQNERSKTAIRCERFRIREFVYQERMNKLRKEKLNGKKLLPY